MSHEDDELRLSEADARFVRRLDALYRPPEPTPAERARFAARLEERIARGRRPWLLGGAAATLAGVAAALALALLPRAEPGTPAIEPAALVAEPAEAPSAEEDLLLLANGPLQDPDEALPEDYQMLASLLD
jgi:hypothetical protein